MTGSTASLTADSSSTASFRAWGLAVSNAITAAGYPKTSDTGQIDWATVTAPASTVTAQGYEIRQFNDSLQATRPIYFKVEYGSGASTSSPNLWITVGTATNGAGTLSSMAGYGTTLGARQSLNAGNTFSAVAMPCLFGGSDGSGLAVALFLNSGTAAGMMFYIERHRNADGTASSEGFCWGYAVGSNSPSTGWQQFLYQNIIQQGTTGSWPSLLINAVTGGLTGHTVGNNIYPMPIFTGFTPRLGAPSLVLAGVKAGEFGINNQFSMTHYGVSRTFAALGPGYSSSGYGFLGSGVPTAGNASFVMRID